MSYIDSPAWAREQAGRQSFYTKRYLRQEDAIARYAICGKTHPLVKWRMKAGGLEGVSYRNGSSIRAIKKAMRKAGYRP